MDEEERIPELEKQLSDLQRKNTELKAQLASRLSAAFDAMPKANELMGSAVILTINGLGGKEIVPPVAIRDGLSLESVAALQRDIAHSFEVATLSNPAMATLVHPTKEE